MSRAGLADRLLRLAEGDEHAVLFTVLDGERAGRKLLVLLDRGETVGDAPSSLEALVPEVRQSRLLEHEGARVFAEVFGPPPRLVVVGAVDTAEALCAAARLLDWRTICVDARAKFATPERIPSADELVVEWPDAAFERILPDRDTAIVVLTHDEKFDVPALRAALATEAFYVGAIGARRTQERRRGRLLEAGVSEEQLARIHGPSGLDLGSETPAETALSILAEALAVRAGRPGTPLKTAPGRIHVEVQPHDREPVTVAPEPRLSRQLIPKGGRMSIAAYSEQLHELVASDAQVEQIATGFTFTEGPIWMPDSSLHFSDMPADKRRRWHPDEGVTVLRDPSNKCNGMTLDNDGNLIVCEHATSSVVRERPDGRCETIASHWDGKELNSPNDVIVARAGSIYFSDPWYGRMPVFGVEREKELDFQGVYRIAPGTGTVELVVDDFEMPNGLCLTADESRLLINDTPRAHIRIFDVDPGGSLSNGRMFFEGVGNGVIEEGIVDGMKLDEQGNVYLSGPGGVWVISAEGEHLGTIGVPENVGNLNWGGPDWKTLYVCACTSVYRVRMKVAGNRLGYMR